MKTQHLHLITFADSRMHLASERLMRQAKEMNIFDTVRAFNQGILLDSELDDWRNFLTPKTRGFGYYSWKPYLIHKQLKKLKEGDILIYLDAGCHLNVRGRSRFIDYIDMLNQDPLGVKLFPVNDTHHHRPCIEQEWTKNDVFAHFNCENRKDVVESLQLAATHVLIRRCPSSLSFIEKWDQTWRNHFSLLDDSPSISPNHPRFIAHRHDQSILSVLYKLAGGTPLPNNECWCPGDWEALKDFPIWDMRDRGQYFRSIVWLWLWKIVSYSPFPTLRLKAHDKIANRLQRRPYLKKYFKFWK